MTLTRTRIRPHAPRRPGPVGIESLERRTLMAAAAPFDPTFGVDGKGKYDVGGLAEGFDAVYALPDGKVLAAGQFTFGYTSNLFVAANPADTAAINRDTRGLLVRLNADGTLDQTFGDGGVARHQSDPYVRPDPDPVHLKDVTRIDQILAIAVQPDGKILAGGSAYNYHPYAGPGVLYTSRQGEDPQVTPLVSDEAFAVARYNADGSVDTTFGRNGVVLADMMDMSVGSGERVSALAVQADGKVVVAGYVNKDHAHGSSEPTGDVGILRLNPDGSADEAFGRKFEDFPAFNSSHPRQESARVILIQPDGKLLFGGGAGGWNGSDHHGDFALFRYNPDGTRDAAFGANGRVMTRFPSAPDPLDLRGIRDNSTISDVTLLPDGKIVAVGTLASGNLAVARYNPDGQLDPGFGSAGLVVTRGAVQANYHAVPGADGTLTVSGVGNGYHYERTENSSIGTDTGLEAFVARLDSAGHVLGSARAERLPAAGRDWAAAFAVQADGKLVLVGNSNPLKDDPINPNPAAGDLADAFAARIDPALLTPDPAGEGRAGGGAGGGTGSVAMITSWAPVRGGKSTRIRLVFTSAEAARAASVTVSGPNGFGAAATLLKVKAGRRGGAAVATFILAAPGGSFDAGDNGVYSVRLGGSAAADAPALGQVIVTTPARKRRS
jgi:uncharacterized delta-60 repeat protein